MKRAVIAACAAILALPAVASAQMGENTLTRPAWGPRVRVTPFIGFVPTVSRTEDWTFSAGGQTAFARYDVELGSGWAGGASFEAQLATRFAVIGSATFASRGRTREFSADLDDLFEHEGANWLMAKAALAVRLREDISELQLRSLSATVFAGPAWLREMPRDDATSDPVLLDAQSYWGINFGVDAALPLMSDQFAVQAGIEDTYMWWDDAELARRNNALLNGITSAVTTDPSHMWMLRVGVSVRLQ